METGTGERGDALADVIKRLHAYRALLRREGIAGVSVFGSVVRGDAREDSDVDLLVEPAAGVRVSGLKLVQWKTLMTELLGRSADVVVREFLDDKIEASMEGHLVEVVFDKAEDAGDAG
jgi:uncharacterized protein